MEESETHQERLAHHKLVVHYAQRHARNRNAPEEKPNQFSKMEHHPSRDNFRWMGGLSHVNSSQKGIYHTNTVELKCFDRIFYGSHLTVNGAETEARAKMDVYRQIRQAHKEDPSKSDYAEYLCGRAPCPEWLYRDPIPAKEQLSTTGQHLWLSDQRMAAVLSPVTHFEPVVGHCEPKAEKIRNFIAGITTDHMKRVREILKPEEEYWDGSDLIAKGQAWTALQTVMLDCQPPILKSIKTYSPKDTNTPIFEHRLFILDCELVRLADSAETAKQQVSLSFLLWIRKQTMDLLADSSFNSALTEPLPLHPKVPVLITDVVMAHYSDLMKLFGAIPNLMKDFASKNVAALVLQDLSNFRVIALAGGNGTILPKATSISKDSSGFLLKDCHAEILVLRAAKLFLYDQLELFFSTDSKKSNLSIFTHGPNRSITTKPGVFLHLYIGQKPCGHADLLQPTPSSTPTPFGLYEKTPRNRSQDPIKPLSPSSNPDGVLRIMSCCDKLQKRCFVGIQGHLLAQLILPVYLGAVVVGSGSNQLPDPKIPSFSAVYGGLEPWYQALVNGGKTPFGYDAISPVVIGGRSVGIPPAKNVKDFTFCHYVDRVSGKCLLEWLNPETGKQTNGAFSMLCKRALFLRFRALYDNIPVSDLPSTATLNPQFRGTYLDCKKAALDYIAQKQIFLDTLFGITGVARPHGHVWIPKNELSEKFTCILESKPTGYSVIGMN